MAPTFRETAPDQIIHEIAMPLIAVRNGAEELVSGTAFLVAPGWAITAYHVLEDLGWRYDGLTGQASNWNVSFELLAFLTLEQGTRHLPLRVLRAWRAAPLDVALMAIGIPSDWPTDHRWKIPALQLLPPRVGTRVFAFGFPNASVGRSPGDSHATAQLHPRTASGEVIEIHHELRDTGKLPFPCFRTDARFDPGMSGGPVISGQTGKVCGVICSSIPATTDDEQHVSYASSLWPVVATLVDVTDHAVSGGTPFPFIELFQSGRVPAPFDLGRVRVTSSGDGSLTAEAAYDRSEWENAPPAA